MCLTVRLLLALEKLEGDYPSIFTIRENKDLRLCKSDQPLYVVQMTSHKLKSTDATSQPCPFKKVSGECQALKGCPEGQISSYNHSALHILYLGEKTFYTHVARNFMPSSCSDTYDWHQFSKTYQEIPSVPLNYTGLSL